jgi:hypothetical protein
MRYSPTAYPSARGFGRSLLVLPQHPDQHRPKDPVLLAVDQQLDVRVFGFPQNSPIRSARSKSGSIRTWSNWAGNRPEGVEALL